MNVRIPRRTLLSTGTLALLVVMVAGYLSSEPARAQREAPPPSDPVLAAVQGVHRSIAGLQLDLDALQAGLDAQLAPLGVRFRWTPPAIALYDRLDCMVVNVSDVQKTIHIELKTGDGSNETEATVSVDPGAIGRLQTLNRDGTYHCRFTVLNGTRADIRAALLGYGGRSASFHSFQIPAE